jgi:CDP-diacylglycerol--glycerol-3-phosphate 3-phosphatidyltransferase
MTISNESRDRVKRVFEPIALGMGRLGLTPNALTLIGFGISIAGAVLLGLQQWVIGGIVVFVGGAFDMFDGTLARATGKTSKLGAFLDSVFDRWGEMAVYVGIVVGCVAADLDRAAAVAALAMGSAFMVSYARAKSEGLGFTAGTGMAEVGLMPREVRLVILSLGLILGGALGIGPTGGEPGSIVFEGALAVIALLATITVIQRIVVVRRQAARQAAGAAVQSASAAHRQENP